MKISQEFFTIEYRLLNLPVNGQVSIPIGEWSEDRVKDEITKDVANMSQEIELLRKLIIDWEGKRITLDLQ